MSTLIAKFKPLLLKVKPLLTLAVGFLAALGVLSLTHLGPAQAQSPGVNLAVLVARLNADDAKIADLQAKTAPITTTGDAALGYLVTIARANVQIVDGTGATGSTSGLGNLVIGYNALGNSRGAGDVRTGSHNLILGDRNNYSSFGGLVVGTDNIISGQYASVSGGVNNKASGDYASVSGGYYNTASGFSSSVSGGAANTASGFYASVSGGEFNVANGDAASVSGGYSNTASGQVTSISGGSGNTASAFYASVSGGSGNTVSGQYASISGGNGLTQSNNYGWTGGIYQSH